MNHIATTPAYSISPQAIDAFLKLCECAESVHHPNIPRPDILEKLAGIDRALINQCFEDLNRISKTNKTYEPNTNTRCPD